VNLYVNIDGRNCDITFCDSFLYITGLNMSQLTVTVSNHSWLLGCQSWDSQLSRITTPLHLVFWVLLWGTRCLPESIHEWRFEASRRERSAAETLFVRCDRAGENCPGCGGQESPRRRQTSCSPGVRGVSFLHSFLLFRLIASYPESDISSCCISW